jgi:hypothetical protein
MVAKKQSTEIRAVAFTYHLAVILNTQCMAKTTTRGRGLWKMNVSMLNKNRSVLSSRKNGGAGSQHVLNTLTVYHGGTDALSQNLGPSSVGWDTNVHQPSGK